MCKLIWQKENTPRCSYLPSGPTQSHLSGDIPVSNVLFQQDNLNANYQEIHPVDAGKLCKRGKFTALLLFLHLGHLSPDIGGWVGNLTTIELSGTLSHSQDCR